MQPRRRSSFLILAVATACGCRGDLPTYHWVDHDTAVRIITDRTARIETISARCRLLLSGADGATTQLDGVLAARLPDHLRIRAWKFSQPAFDLTMTPEGLWRFAREDRSKDAGTPLDGLTARRFSRGWLMLVEGGVGPGWKPLVDDGGSRVRFRRETQTPGVSVVCEMDRATLTVTRCDLVDAEGVTETTLQLDRYRLIGDFIWPARAVLRSEHGSVTMLFDDVRINTDLPPGAFVAPRRSVKVP